jgi:hypothetical protein
MDPENPVVKLCAEGMQAEGQGRNDEARRLFEAAWEARTNDFEACIAAHYLARHQPDPRAMLQWNREALVRADASDDATVRSFYPSLYLNLGHSYEQLGDREQACRHYRAAADRLADVPPGPYGDIVRAGVAEGQKRMCVT